MPIITDSAVALLNDAWIQPSFAQQISNGPWKINGTYFAAVGVPAGSPPGTFYTPVIQTSADGITYATQYSSSLVDLVNATIDGANIYLLGTGGFQPFNVNSLTFGSSTAGPTTLSLGGSIIVLDNGNVLLVYSDGANINASLYNGSWTTTALDTAGSQFSQIWLSLKQSNGTCHLGWLRVNNDGTFNIRYCYCDATGVTFSSAATIYSDSNPPNGFVQGSHQGLMDEADDAIYLPWIWYDGNEGHTVPSVLRGTPISAPVWSVERIDPTGTSLPDYSNFRQRNATLTSNLTTASCVFVVTPSSGTYAGVCLGIKGATPTNLTMVFDVSQISSSFNTPRYALWYSERSAGVWQAPIDWFDTDTSPIGIISATGDNTGMGIETAVSVPSPLSGSCPANNTIAAGRPYSGQIGVDGGTPPYTFALTSGSFPPGITLDGSTGVVSGTSTVTGTYPWEVTITDADGSTVVVSCSTTIGCPPAPSLLLELTGDTPSVGVIIIPTTKSLL